MNMSGPFNFGPITEPWEVVKQAARDAGRDPATLGLHVRAAGPNPDETAKNVAASKAFGVTHATVGDRDVPDPKAQLQAIIDQKAAIG